MPNPIIQVLLYTGPILVNGTLWVIGYVKKRTSHYTMIGQGIGFIVGLLLASIVLNSVLGVWSLLHHYYWLAGVYGTLALVVAVLLLRGK